MSDDRKRATRKGGEPDTLISLNDFKDAMDAFSDDKFLNKYKRAQRINKYDK